MSTVVSRKLTNPLTETFIEKKKEVKTLTEVMGSLKEKRKAI